jgi:hypothetical protein
MPEVIGTFLSTKLWHERANGSVESSRSGLAQQRIEFAVGHLDGIEVGRVLRQVANCRPSFLDRLPDSGDLVGSEIVHNDDVVALKGWDQALLDISRAHPTAEWLARHVRRGAKIPFGASARPSRA